MRKQRLLVTLLFALGAGSLACDDSQEDLSTSADNLARRGGDGGEVRGDRDEDSDETVDEAARGDGGRGHHHRKGKKMQRNNGRFNHGDGGFDCERGEGRGEGRGHGRGDERDDRDAAFGDRGQQGRPEREQGDGGSRGRGGDRDEEPTRGPRDDAGL